MQGMIGETFFIQYVMYIEIYIFNLSVTLFFNSSVSGKTEEGETEESLHVSKLNCYI